MFRLLNAPSSAMALGPKLFPDKSGSSFRIWAPFASAVNLLIQPDSRTAQTSFALAEDIGNTGYWSADIAGAVIGHLYQYAIQNRGGDPFDPGGLPVLRADPCARQVVSSDPKLPGVISDPDSYAFNVPFQTPAFQNFIIYQAHVGSFAGKNDGIPVTTDANGGTASFAQFGTKLDYIRSMNFNAVQFLPTGEYRGSERSEEHTS